MYEDDVEFEDDYSRPADGDTPQFADVRRALRDARRELKEAHRERDALRPDAVAWKAVQLGVSDPRHAAAIVRLHGDEPATIDAVKATLEQSGLAETFGFGGTDDEDDDE